MTEMNQPETELLLNGVPYEMAKRYAQSQTWRRRWKRRLLIGVLMIETCFARAEVGPRAIPQHLQLDLQLHSERHRRFT